MDWPKITGYVGVTSSAISIIAQISSAIIPEQGLDNQVRDTLRWSNFLWSYAIVTMALYITRTSHKPIYVWIGIAIALFCLSLRSEFGIGIGLIYFFWAYAKLDQRSGNLPF